MPDHREKSARAVSARTVFDGALSNFPAQVVGSSGLVSCCRLCCTRVSWEWGVMACTLSTDAEAATVDRPANMACPKPYEIQLATTSPLEPVPFFILYTVLRVTHI